VKLTAEEKAVFKRIATAGGVARAKSLTKARKVEIASRAGKARWDAEKVRKAVAYRNHVMARRKPTRVSVLKALERLRFAKVSLPCDRCQEHHQPVRRHVIADIDLRPGAQIGVWMCDSCWEKEQSDPDGERES
jgi:hypothetical protein